MDALRQQAAKAGSAYQEWAALHVSGAEKQQWGVGKRLRARQEPSPLPTPDTDRRYVQLRGWQPRSTSWHGFRCVPPLQLYRPLVTYSRRSVNCSAPPQTAQCAAPAAPRRRKPNQTKPQALQDGGHFQALGLGPDVQAEVLGKQLQALNEALAGVHAAL
jgi:hypothetical protein